LVKPVSRGGATGTVLVGLSMVTPLALTWQAHGQIRPGVVATFRYNSVFLSQVVCA